MTYLTPERTIQLLREVVEEFGADYVYPKLDTRECGLVGINCFYVDEGKPSCIVAQVLTRNGETLEKLAKYEGRTPRESSMISAFDLSPEVAKILWTAQDAQDAEKTWGEALRLAETRTRVLESD